MATDPRVWVTPFHRRSNPRARVTYEKGAPRVVKRLTPRPPKNAHSAVHTPLATPDTTTPHHVRPARPCSDSTPAGDPAARGGRPRPEARARREAVMLVDAPPAARHAQRARRRGAGRARVARRFGVRRGPTGQALLPRRRRLVLDVPTAATRAPDARKGGE